jgi:hypothetical protein
LELERYAVESFKELGFLGSVAVIAGVFAFRKWLDSW